MNNVLAFLMFFPGVRSTEGDASDPFPYVNRVAHFWAEDPSGMLIPDVNTMIW